MRSPEETKGFFVSFEYSQDALSKTWIFFKKTGKDYHRPDGQRHFGRTNRLETGVKKNRWDKPHPTKLTDIKVE